MKILSKDPILVNLRAEAAVEAMESAEEMDGEYQSCTYLFHVDASVFPNMDRLGIRISERYMPLFGF